MKLCWLISTAGGGGGASVALSCCRQAEKAGHDPTLLVMGPIEDWLEEYAIDFPVRSLDLHPGERDRTPEVLLEWLDENPQQILFHNDVQEAHPAIPYLPEDLRFVYVVHDTARMYWKQAVEKETYLDGIVAVSNVIAKQLRDRLLTPEKLYVAHNGTLFPQDIPLDGERADDLVFLGGGKHIKGAYDVLPLWKNLSQAGFSGRLHWFGTVDKSLREEISRLPRADQIVVHGYVPRSTIFETSAHSKVVLMLSRVEPFGMATVECMGMGCLPVAWDIETGTTEIVSDGETGFLTPLGDTDALNENVLRACDQHTQLWSQAARHARSEFSESAMWNRYSRIIDVIVRTKIADRPNAGTQPPRYTPPTRFFQLLPDSIRTQLREFIGKSPRLGYWLRDMRGY